MTRFTFGGQLPDTVAGLYNATPLTGTPGLTLLASLSGTTVTAWTAPVGGVQVTDLLDSNGLPTSMIPVVNANITQFQGPNDGTTALWMDAGGPRALLLASNVLDARVANLESILGLGLGVPFAPLVGPAFSGTVTVNGVTVATAADIAGLVASITLLQQGVSGGTAAARTALILVRQDTAANWTSVNPVLAAGEIGEETGGPAPLLKVGDGVTAWSALPYLTTAASGPSALLFDTAGSVYDTALWS